MERTTSLFVFFAFLLLLLVSSSTVIADENVAFIELTTSAPRYVSQNVLDQGESAYFKFTIPSDDVDVRIRLSVYDGDADVYALNPSSSDDVVPSSGKYDYRSEHAHADDVIFISRYDVADVREKVFNGESLVGKYFLVAVEGWAAHGSKYAIKFETFTNARSLSEAHKTALGDIFDACCSSSESLRRLERRKFVRWKWERARFVSLRWEHLR